MSEKRRRDDAEGEGGHAAGCNEPWPQSRVDSLDKFLQSVRERVLSDRHLDDNPLQIIVAHVSANQQALAEKFFPSWPCMSPECAAGEFETCCHVPRTSSSGSDGDPSAIMAASTPWTSRRDDLCPPAGKFVGTWEYPSGNAEEHRRGLHQRIGYPCVSDFEEGMRLEHCIKVGCDHAFSPRNYRHLWDGTTTTPADEWSMVVQGRKADRRPAPACQMAGGRRRVSIDELMQLPLVATAGLLKAEIIGIALYTGPMYEVYNCILQQQSFPPDLWQTFQHNHFPTTLTAIVSAVQKLGCVTPVALHEKLYRGNGGSQYLPSRFFSRDDMNVRGMTAYGFQSFTTSIEQAIIYARPDAQLPMVFVIEPSTDPLTGFADVSDFSQFPHERERLLPPCSFLHPDMLKSYSQEIPNHGSVEMVPMRATASHLDSLNELERKKKKFHIAEFETRVAELRERLENTARKHKAEDRLQTAAELNQKQNWKGKHHSVATLLDSIVAKVNEVLKRHQKISHKTFNSKHYAAIVQESLDCIRMAPSLLKLWLHDDTEYIHHLLQRGG